MITDDILSALIIGRYRLRVQLKDINKKIRAIKISKGLIARVERGEPTGRPIKCDPIKAMEFKSKGLSMRETAIEMKCSKGAVQYALRGKE